MTGFVMIAFQLTVLIFSIIIHEISHGAAALYLGDDTAKRLGRLTLNPLKHLDPFGSLILPGLLVLINSPVVFGWAKPVPYNPYNLPNPKKGAAIIGAAGPLSNILIAVIFAFLLKISLIMGLINPALISGFLIIIFLNLILAFFNLIPIPPLDGSKLLFGLLPNMSFATQRFLEVYGFLILIILLFFFGLFRFLIALVFWLSYLLLVVALNINLSLMCGSLAGIGIISQHACQSLL